jgi:hypothetical protein
VTLPEGFSVVVFSFGNSPGIQRYAKRIATMIITAAITNGIQFFMDIFNLIFTSVIDILRAVQKEC